MGRKTPKITPSPLDFVTMPEEDRATAIGNMHKKLVKIAQRGSEDMLADGETDRRTNRHTDRRAHHDTSPPLSRVK